MVQNHYAVSTTQRSGGSEKASDAPTGGASGQSSRTRCGPRSTASRQHRPWKALDKPLPCKRDPQAFFSTDTTLDPTEIISLFVRRWQVEVTFAETHAHLGVETQRQWSDKAIARITPALFGLYSLIALWACELMSKTTTPYAAAWYRKKSLTFTDAIAAVRLALWVGDVYRHSPPNRDRREIPTDRLARMAEALCFAA